MTIKNTLLGGTDNTNGDIIDADDVNDTNDAIITTTIYNVPIGAVVSWLKSYTNTPALPVGWVECDGATLTDADSVYNGQVIPDLNGDNRFLRGNSTSGDTGGSETHTHDVVLTKGDDADIAGAVDVIDPGTYTSNATSTLPTYYGVVWIMRVK